MTSISRESKIWQHRLFIHLEAKPTKLTTPRIQRHSITIPIWECTLFQTETFRRNRAFPSFEYTQLWPTRKCMAPSTVWSQQGESRVMLAFAIGHLMITNNGLQLLHYTYKPRCLESGTSCVMLATLFLFLVAVVRPLPVAGIGIDFPSRPPVSISLQASRNVCRVASVSWMQQAFLFPIGRPEKFDYKYVQAI
jgi:hypothetical protein